MGWNAKATGAYGRHSTEAEENVYEMWRVFRAYGFTDTAVAGVIGNAEYEGGLNPWRWEILEGVGDDPPDFPIPIPYGRGYGLFQYTTANKYINPESAGALDDYAPNFANSAGDPNDGKAQIEWLITLHPDQYQPAIGPYYTLDAYKVAEDEPEDMARYWLYNFEIPADPEATLPDRQSAARYWYDWMQGQDPPSPEGDTKTPFWITALRTPILRRRY